MSTYVVIQTSVSDDESHKVIMDELQTRSSAESALAYALYSLTSADAAIGLIMKLNFSKGIGFLLSHLLRRAEGEGFSLSDCAAIATAIVMEDLYDAAVEQLGEDNIFIIKVN